MEIIMVETMKACPFCDGPTERFDTIADVPIVFHKGRPHCPIDAGAITLATWNQRAHPAGGAGDIVERLRALAGEIDPLMVGGRDAVLLNKAADLIQSLQARLSVSEEALAFYADPETYHACSFLFDRPTGGFDEDFDEDHGHEDYDRPMPGKRARACIASLREG
jgi:hypothetical protein